MSFSQIAKNCVTKRFITIAQELQSRFPDLDLHFNLQENSNKIRLFSAFSEEVIEISLTNKATNKLIEEAIIDIREMLKRSKNQVNFLN